MNDRPNRERSLWQKVGIALTLICLVGSSGIYAQQGKGEYRFNKEFFNHFGEDWVGVVSSPLKWNSRDLWNLTAVLGGGALLYTVDENIHDWVQENKTPFSEDASGLVSHFGHGIFLGSLITSLYAGGEIFHSTSLRKTALLSLEGWLTSGVLVLGIKFLTGRARPYTDKRSSAFRPFSLESSFHSFPSGHSSSAFAVASVVAEQTEGDGVDFLVYSLAALAALSRVHDNKHWPSDVFVGSALGYFVGKKICDLRKNSKENSLHLSFHLAGDRQSLTLSLRF